MYSNNKNRKYQRSTARRTTIRRALVVAAFACVLTACDLKVRSDEPPELTVVVPEGDAFELFYSCQQKLLQDLRDASARADCEQAYAINPVTQPEYNPKLLLDQLEVEPQHFLNSERASIAQHTVRPNENLKQVAARELGNGFLFVALARDNCIDTPSAPSLEGRVINLTGGGECATATATYTARDYLRDCRTDLLTDLASPTVRDNCQRALDMSPGNREAARLLEQLDRDPRELFPLEPLAYRVQSGDSLGEIAQRFLGSEIWFVALARYNGITNPSLLEVGQELQIPADPSRAGEAPVVADLPTSSAPPASTPPAAALASDDDVSRAAKQEALDSFSRRDYAGVIAVLTYTPGVTLDTEMTELLADAKRLQSIEKLLEEAEKTAELGDYRLAHNLYQRVLRSDPENAIALAKSEEIRSAHPEVLE